MTPNEGPSDPQTSRESVDPTWIPSQPPPRLATPVATSVTVSAPQTVETIDRDNAGLGHGMGWLYVGGLGFGLAFGAITTFVGFWTAVSVSLYGLLGLGAAHAVRRKIERRLHIRRAIFELFRGP